jgi:hypothetical protein
VKNKIDFIQIFKKLEDIEKRLEKPLTVDDYVSERDAKKMLKRGTTWFWEKRNQGLPSFKVGGEVYYMKSDLLSLIKDQ